MSEYPGLRNVIREVCASTDLVDPREIAAKAVEQVPHEKLREELVAATVGLVRNEFHFDRNAPEDLAETVVPISAPVHGKAARMRKHDWLQARECVNGRWKLLRDCTAEDFEWIAADRRKQAVDLNRAADRYAGYAQFLREHNARSAADLTSEQIIAMRKEAA